MTNSGTCTPQQKDHALDSTPLWRGKTQAWIETQGVWRSRSPMMETCDWIWEKYLKETKEIETQRQWRQRESERKWWEATAKSIDRQARRWMAQAEAARQAALLEAEKTKRLQEEIKRTKERLEARERRKRQLKEEVKMMGDDSDGEKIRKQKKRDRADKRLVEAWEKYESRWATLLSSSSNERLTFRTIPWPLVSTPSTPSCIVPAHITFFLLSNLHSSDKTQRERLRDAIQRWHNDKFEPRILPRVEEEDRNAVKEGVGIVIRCLNELLQKRQTMPIKIFDSDPTSFGDTAIDDTYAEGRKGVV
ncbi:hypothetical protein Clacol_000776 [Clathrus columnatus]|uniref:Uncharacterized protein n=1 Tax=Clathrus columnatus TaxID=1419009 RepID=A0AAV5A1R9_9AGAM|nr:hypothetical protein Clacol_000776 [Clathrus columnatus]